MDTFQQVAVIPQGRESSVAGQRQRRSIAEKRRIVEETLIEGASVARVARAHGINANQVFGWRRLYLAGRLGEQKASMKKELMRHSTVAMSMDGYGRGIPEANRLANYSLVGDLLTDCVETVGPPTD